MPSRREAAGSLAKAEHGRETHVAPSLPLAEVLSFLKESRGEASWNAQDMAKSLNVSTAVAKQVIPLLQLQGYIGASGGEWVTTAAGEAVSGSKPPRFTPEAVEAALSVLAGRIKAINQDADAAFKITGAVAFGDFLMGRARVQAADVGVQLSPRKPASGEAGSAVEAKAEREFLKRLKGNGSTLNIRPYEEWMSSRSHRKLL
jgi:hypothetical protein